MSSLKSMGPSDEVTELRGDDVETDQGPEPDTLDWSVSGISALSGATERNFQPSEWSSQASSIVGSPRKSGGGF